MIFRKSLPGYDVYIITMNLKKSLPGYDVNILWLYLNNLKGCNIKANGMIYFHLKTRQYSLAFLMIVLRTAGNHLTISLDDVSHALAGWGGAGVEGNPFTLVPKLESVAVLRDELVWVWHPIDVELVHIRLRTLRDSWQAGAHLRTPRDIRSFCHDAAEQKWQIWLK